MNEPLNDWELPKRVGPWEQTEDLSDGVHGQKHVYLEGAQNVHIGSGQKETIPFPAVVVTKTTLAPETTKTFEKMQKLMSTGIIAMIVMGVCFLVSSGLCTYFGIRYVQLEQEKVIEEIRLKNWKERVDTDNGMVPFEKPKEKP